MSVLLLVGLLSYHRPPEALERRSNPRYWLTWIAMFVLIDLAVALIANSPIAGNLAVRLSMEGGALTSGSGLERKPDKQSGRRE